MALALSIALVLLLGGCGGGNKNVDAKAVLAQCSTAMKTITGFHFVYEVHKPSSAKPGSGLVISRITGDVDKDGHMKASVDATFGGIPVTVGFVSLGETQYIQDPVSKKWQKLTAADSPVGNLSLAAGTILILDEMTNVSYVGQDSKGGASTYHIKGTITAEQVKAIAGSVSVPSTTPFPTDIWVGVNDHYVYEVDFAGAATTDEDPKTTRSIVLSKQNESVDITAPQ